MKGITFCSIRGRYLENGCKRLEEITKYKIPDADTVYTRLSKKNFKEILDEFYSIQNKILSQIKDTKDGIVVFIDLN
ncbi:MAG: hypothetical protein H5T45_00710 [Thermoplasmatales archaeon]|nr:hypothetical protein [Thermoplasmatales archaeon]